MPREVIRPAQLDRAGLRPLLLRVRPAPWESADSLLNRIAIRHGCESVKSFLGQVPGVSPDNVTWHEKIILAAALNAQCEFELSLSTPCSYDGGAEVAYVYMNAAEVNIGRRRGSVCVQCLRDDLEHRQGSPECRSYMRGYWQIVSSCRTHGVWLLDKCPSCSAKLSRTRLHASRCRCGADLLGGDLNPVTDAAYLSEEEPMLLEAQGIAPAEPTFPFPACTGRCGRACSVDHRIRFSRTMTELQYRNSLFMLERAYGQPELPLFGGRNARTLTVNGPVSFMRKAQRPG